jgi:hypothetical protein
MQWLESEPRYDWLLAVIRTRGATLDRSSHSSATTRSMSEFKPVIYRSIYLNIPRGGVETLVRLGEIVATSEIM